MIVAGGLPPRPGSLRCRRVALVAVLLLGALLLLLLFTEWTPPCPHHASATSSPALNSFIPMDTSLQWMSDKDDEVLPAGIVRVRERFVPGHARAHAELCGARGARTQLVVLVASAPAHVEKRMAVRLTWGQVARRADVALGFVLGAPSPALRAELDAEDALYGDLIEGHYVDSYGNLTLKTLSMLEWFVRYCPQAAWLLRSDDDMFINIEGLLRFTEAPNRRQVNSTVWGNVWPSARPFRNTNSKYFVPPEEFPGNKYPRYLSGGAYIVTGDAVGALLRATLSARWLRMDDVLVTGVAAEAAGVHREASPPLVLGKRAVSACALRGALAVHQVPFLKQFDLWRELHDFSDKCSARKSKD